MGLPVYAETCPQYFHLTWNDLVSIRVHQQNWNSVAYLPSCFVEALSFTHLF